MAKYDILHSCGHTAEHDLVGPGKERERRMDYLRGEPCTACWREANPTKAEAFARSCKGGVEIFVLNSFEIKDALKARGYRFGEYSRPGADIGKALMGGSKGWGKILATTDLAVAEVEALGALGVRVSVRGMSPIESAIVAVVEGRPDLVPDAKG